MFSGLASSQNIRLYNYAQGIFFDYKLANGMKLDQYEITSTDQCPQNFAYGLTAATTAMALLVSALAF